MNTLKELYLEAARVAGMIKGINLSVGECFKFDGEQLFGCITFYDAPSRYEACLAVVEGKPVFKGDALWNKTYNMIFIAEFTTCAGIYSSNNGSGAVFAECSWNKPKPRTVMVELSYEFVANNASYERDTDFVLACRKALEGLKS